MESKPNGRWFTVNVMIAAIALLSIAIGGALGRWSDASRPRHGMERAYLAPPCPVIAVYVPFPDSKDVMWICDSPDGPREVPNPTAPPGTTS